jgi:hypothetical protein
VARIGGTLKTGISTAQQVSNLLTPKGQPKTPVVDPKISGGISLGTGAAKLVNAFTGEGDTGNKIIGGVAGGLDLVSGVSKFTPAIANAFNQSTPGFTPPAKFEGTNFDYALQGVGTALGAASLALNWDKMPDYQKAIQTAQVATSALAMAGYAIPYVGPVLAIAGMIAPSLLGGKDMYVAARGEAGHYVNLNQGWMRNRFMEARSMDEIDEAANQATARSQRVTWSRDGGSGAYEMDWNPYNSMIKKVVGAKEKLFNGSLKPDDPGAIEVVQIAREQNKIATSLKASMLTPEGLASQDTFEKFQTVRPYRSAHPWENFNSWSQSASYEDRWHEMAKSMGYDMKGVKPGEIPPELQKWAEAARPFLEGGEDSKVAWEKLSKMEPPSEDKFPGNKLPDWVAPYNSVTKSGYRIMDSFYKTFTGDDPVASNWNQTNPEKAKEYWGNVADVNKGGLYHGVVFKLMNSPEYDIKNKTGDQFVVDLHRGILGRDPTQQEISSGLARAVKGPQAAAELVNDMLTSDEFQDIMSGRKTPAGAKLRPVVPKKKKTEFLGEAWQGKEPEWTPRKKAVKAEADRKAAEADSQYQTMMSSDAGNMGG